MFAILIRPRDLVASSPALRSSKSSEIADPQGQHFEAVEMLVDTGATFTKAPRDLLERLGVPVERFYTAKCSPTAAAWNGPGAGP